MTKIKLLMINYTKDSLIRELIRKGYEVSTANTMGNHLVPRSTYKKFDLVYFAKFTPPRWDDIGLLIHKIGIPIIYGFHAPSIIFKPYRATNYIDNIISVAKLVYMKISRTIIAMHALNTDEYKLLRFCGFRCHYIPLGVDTKLFKPSVKRNKFTVVFVSARYQKGADMLINIVPKVLRKTPDIKFILTDVGFLSNYFNSLKNGFSGNVEVCERMPQNEFAQLFSSSHLLLFPSRWETFGLVVLEALSSGMPVVCYDIAGASRDIVKRHGAGFVVNPFNTDEIVDGILNYFELWKNEIKEFECLSNVCRNVALKYDWSIIAGLFDDMLKQVSSYAREDMKVV